MNMTWSLLQKNGNKGSSSIAAAEDELAAAAEFDVTLVNTSVQDVCRQLIPLL